MMDDRDALKQLESHARRNLELIRKLFPDGKGYLDIRMQLTNGQVTAISCQGFQSSEAIKPCRA